MTRLWITVSLIWTKLDRRVQVRPAVYGLLGNLQWHEQHQKYFVRHTEITPRTSQRTRSRSGGDQAAQPQDHQPARPLTPANQGSSPDPQYPRASEPSPGKCDPLNTRRSSCASPPRPPADRQLSRQCDPDTHSTAPRPPLLAYQPRSGLSVRFPSHFSRRVRTGPFSPVTYRSRPGSGAAAAGVGF